MNTPETRTINTCTYTPIALNQADNDQDGEPLFRVDSPFSKRKLLVTAFDNRAISEVVIEKLPDDERTPEDYKRLKEAVRYIWEGDIQNTASILNDIDLRVVYEFSHEALETEQRLFNTAAEDFAAAIETATMQVNAGREALTMIKREISSTRNAILDKLRRASQTRQPQEGDDAKRADTPSRLDDAPVIEPAEDGLDTDSAPPPVRPMWYSGEVLGLQNDIASLQRAILREIEGLDLTSSQPTLGDDSIPYETPLVDTPQVLTPSETIDPDFYPLYEPPTFEQVLVVLEEDFEDSHKFLEEILRPLWKEPFELQVMEEAAATLVTLEVQQEVVKEKKKAVKAQEELAKYEPAGYLHLERLNFTPMGYVRGELVYSLPLAPGETVRLSHREWSRTEEEYVKLVATSLETASEEALSEKSELTRSFNTQQQHNTAFDASASVSGGYGPVKFSSSVSYHSDHAETNSRAYSAQRAQEITRKASSRSKEDHKVSFRVTTEYEVEEQSFREITNPFPRVVRWDFHRLMQKWRIDLYRYDIRLTYDVVIPEPGSDLVRKYVFLMALERQLAQPFDFLVRPEEISDKTDANDSNSWFALMKKYGVSLESPPPESIKVTAHKFHEYSSSEQDIGGGFLEIYLPEGYEFSKWEVQAEDAYDMIPSDDGPIIRHLGHVSKKEQENTQRLESGMKYSNHYVWSYAYHWAAYEDIGMGTQLTIYVDVTATRTNQALAEWRMQCYETLLDAAQMQYQVKRNLLTTQRDALLEELDREDSLSLRKIEREEIMKGVLRWLVGFPGSKFEFYSEDSPNLPEPVEDFLKNGKDGDEFYAAKTQLVTKQHYQPTLEHGALIQFLHHAIEWENVNYVLYPYFWTDVDRWAFKQGLYHGDFEYRNFLRAGAARVILTIRPGFEKAFLSFMKTGSLDEVEDEDIPYLKIADEIKALADTNYKYTPGANPEDAQRLVDTWYEFTPTGALDIVEGTVLDDDIGTSAAEDRFPFPTSGQISSTFTTTHPALDFAEPVGTEFKAATTGFVIRITDCPKCITEGPNVNPDDVPAKDVYNDPGWAFGYGYSITVRYDYMLLPAVLRKRMDELGFAGGFAYVLYGHLSRIDLKKDETVDDNTVLGATGETGYVTGPNLQIEVRVGYEEYVEGKWLKQKAVHPSLMFV